MVSGFMISRWNHRFLSLAFGLAIPLLTVACQKVPLLAPTGSTIVLTSSATALSTNGTANLTAQVLEQSGYPPHSGTVITFTTTLGSVEPAQASTNTSGLVNVTFNSGTANGTATIVATSGGATAPASGGTTTGGTATSANMVKIAVGTAAVGRVSVNASPATVPNTGGSTTITATVLDINGNLLTSAPVSFTTTAGTLSATIATTGASGVAATTLTTSQTSTVTASVGATPPTGGTTTPPASGTASGSVTVNISTAPTLSIGLPTTPPSAGLPASFTFTVTAAGTNGSAVRDVTVNWGDGNTQDLGAIVGGAVVSHVYQLPGTYAINATLTDSSGNVVNAFNSVTVSPKPQPTVSISTAATIPTAGTDLTFTASVAPAAGNGTVIQDVTINYGEPGAATTSLGPITGTNIALHHVYQTSGTYTAVLRATDSNGSVGTAATSVFVQAAPPLGVTLTASLTNNGLTNTIATFTATVTGLGNSVVTQYLWNFADSTAPVPSTTNQITHNYTHTGVAIQPSVTITTSALPPNNTASASTVITP
jgi:hypothetical protein